MATNQPIIAHENLLSSLQDGTGSYSITTGADSTSSSFSEVANKNLGKPALPIADGTGALVIEISFPNITSAQAFIMGGHRHDSSGFKTTGGTFTLEYWNGAWASLIASTTITAGYTSTIYKLAAHTIVVSGGVYKYRLSYSGFTALATIKIPELFLGTVLEMPFVEYGYDDYNEVFKGSKFESVSGKVIKNLYYIRLELSPKWKNVVRADYDVSVKNFREVTLENLRSFWWAWLPDDAQNEVYFMFHNGNKVAYPIVRAVHRSFSLKLVEDV